MTILLKYIFGKRSKHQTAQGPNQGTDTLEQSSTSVALITWGNLRWETSSVPHQDTDAVRAGSSSSQDHPDSRGKTQSILSGNSDSWPSLGFNGWTSAWNSGKKGIQNNSTLICTMNYFITDFLVIKKKQTKWKQRKTEQYICSKADSFLPGRRPNWKVNNRITMPLQWVGF